ncbi:MAG TPA: COX15/CtaA family protein [Blastocatellia bacterium]|nr:COX15/CtaA family protein [Blastocatellia bacterium]
MKDQKGINDEWRLSRGLHWFAIAVACFTVVLLIIGALVTSNEAGDSVPDWPLSFGRWLIDSDYFVANVRYEYSHRFVAGVVGVLTFALALIALFVEKRSWVRRLAWAAFAGVVAQAMIGGVRVLLGESSKPFIAVPHALVAQSFFATLVGIAVFTSQSWMARREIRSERHSPRLRSLSAVAVASVLIQLVLGAGFRHGAFGIMPHIIGAITVTVLVIWTAVTVLRRHGEDSFLARPAVGALILLVIQLGLGVSAYLARAAAHGNPQPLEPMITLTVAHVVVGALTLAQILVLTLRCYRALAPQGERAEGIAEATALSSTRKATV